MILGVINIIAALSLLKPIWTNDNDLTYIEGPLSSANTYVNKIKSYSRTGSREYYRYTLIFYLAGCNKKFSLATSADNNYEYDIESGKIQKKLNHSRHVRVWISKEDTNEYAPDIYAIDIDGNEAMSLGRDFENQQKRFIFLMIGGILLTILPFLYYNYLEEDKETNTVNKYR